MLANVVDCTRCDVSEDVELFEVLSIGVSSIFADLLDRLLQK